MNRDLFGFKDEPFSAYPDNKYFFSSILHDKAITLLEYGLNSRKGFMLLTGLKGTGKTVTCNILSETVTGCNVSMITYEKSSPDKLMQDICKGFGQTYKEKESQALFGKIMEYFVSQYKEGKNNLIIIDNAENISDENLMMLNSFMEIEIEKCKLVQVVLSGCPELHDRLKQLGGDLGPKFTFTVELAPLNLKDTTDYVEHRLKTAIGDDEHQLFKRNSYILIYDYSKGVPSEINRIAHKALEIAKDKNLTKVTPRHIKMAAARLYGVKVSRRRSNKPVFAAVFIILIAGGYFYYTEYMQKNVSTFAVKQETVAQNAEKTFEEPAEKIQPAPDVVNKPAEKTEETADVQDAQTVTEQNKQASAPDLETSAEQTEPEKTEPVKEEPVKPEPEKAVLPDIKHGCITAQSGLKVRSGPSVQDELIGTAPYMAYIELYELTNDGNWWKTRYDNTDGYMYARYIKVVESPDECSEQ